MSNSNAPDWLNTIAGGEEVRSESQTGLGQSRPTARLVFRPRALRELIPELIMLVVLIGLTVFLLAMNIAMVLQASTITMSAWQALGFTGLVLPIPFVLIIWFYLRARRGRLVLMEDRILEFNPFDTRKYAYDQIYEVAHHVQRGYERCIIRFYPRGPLGEIDYSDIRWTYLLNVSQSRQLAEALQQRISAPPPSGEVRRRDTTRQMLLPLAFLGSMIGLIGLAKVVEWLIQNYPAWSNVWMSIVCLAFGSWLAVIFILGGRAEMRGG